MTKRIALFTTLLFTAVIVLQACKHKPYVKPEETYGGFPDEVGKIITNRCATAGCHNAASYTAAGDLRMDSWEELFNGGRHGAAVVPYSTGNSPLLFYINTDSTLGPVVKDNRMPPVDAGSALTKDEYLAIRSWIAAGAPDRNGKIPFGDNADTRQKIYLVHQGCDIAAVIDGEKKVVMRYISLTPGTAQSSPHCIRVSGDGAYSYISYLNAKSIQKINTVTDKVESSVVLKDNGSSSWNILYVSPDSKELMVSNWIENGFAAWVNAQTMTQYNPIPFTLKKPHGIASNAAGDTFFITSEPYNAVYKLVPPRNGKPAFLDTISIVDGQAPDFVNTATAPQPHEIMMTPDHSKYFLTCQRSNEVRVMDAHTDKVLAVFNVAERPQEIAMSVKQPYVFISCMESTKAGQYKGVIEVINYKTLQKVKTITGNFNQPHGVTVDDRNNTIYVFSTNVDGPAPHHPSGTGCNGKNGYYNIFNLNTLEPVNNRNYEVSVFPYSADVRFK